MYHKFYKAAAIIFKQYNVMQVHVHCRDIRTYLVNHSRILLGEGAIVGDTVHWVVV